MPKVSVIIPCYNQAHFLGKAIKSVLEQNEQDVEIIVVNDGSTDDTEEVVKKYPQIIQVDQTNQGVANARNNGFANSKGKLIVFLDADDYLGPKSLEAAVASLNAAPDAVFSYGVMQSISTEGSPIAQRRPVQRASPFCDLLADNFIPTPGMVMFRRSTLKIYGLFDQSFTPAEDYDLYLRITRKAPITHHSEIAVFRRFHPDATTNKAASMLRSVLSVHRKFRKASEISTDCRENFLSGARFWREWYGSQLTAQLRNSLFRLQFSKAAMMFARLITLYPKGLKNVFRWPLKSKELVFHTKLEKTGHVMELKIDTQSVPDKISEEEKIITFIRTNKQENADLNGDLIEGKVVFTLTCHNANRGAVFYLNQEPVNTVWRSLSTVMVYIPEAKLRAPGPHNIFFVY